MVSRPSPSPSSRNTRLRPNSSASKSTTSTSSNTSYTSLSRNNSVTSSPASISKNVSFRATVPLSPSPSSSKPTSPVIMSAIQVVVRLRPMNEQEKVHNTLPVVTASSSDKTVTVVKGSGVRQAKSSYAFDNVFSAFTTQEEIFQHTLRPIIGDVMKGFDCTVFAYGQTGTGKTHTMEGDLSSRDLHGIIPRSIEAIFETLEQPEFTSFTVTCSYLEIYNEELCDLFAEDYAKTTREKKQKVEIMETKDGTVCRGQIQIEVKTAEDVLDLMRRAQQHRKIGETKMNKNSSRSHCIFTIRINASKELIDGSVFKIQGKLHLVDLAGSECAKTASKGKEMARDRERSNINRSLLTLGRVILMLKEQSEGKKSSSHVRIPYRDSKLTRILQKSLGGQCKTLVVATLSPSVTSIEESISTLNYAQSANGIINKPVATSFLSMSGNGSAASAAASAASDMSSAASVEHWFEMEVKLQYMQAQVEEAQAALARTYTVQQEIEDRAKKAEDALEETEKKYEDAIEEIENLKKELEAEKKEKMTLALVLKKTEEDLKKTTAILKATQKTEVALTSEANSLIDTIKDSIQDGDVLHKNLLDVRESEIQRRQATQKFHSVTANMLDDVVTTIKEFSKLDQDYCDGMVENSKKDHEAYNASLDLSTKLVAKLSERVGELTSSIKSNVEDETGILSILTKISKELQENVDQTKNNLTEGEDQLTDSLQNIRDQLVEYSNNLKRMDSEYIQSTDRLMDTLGTNLTNSNEKIATMVTTFVDSLTTVRAANSETRTTLAEIIGKLESDSTRASTAMENLSSEQIESLVNGMEDFATGRSHINDMGTKLGVHRQFIDEKGSACVQDIAKEREMLEAHKEAILETKKEQEIMRESFVAEVLDGVKLLVQEQMSAFSKKQEEHLDSFGLRNKEVQDMNNGIGLATDNILVEMKEANSVLTAHVEEADKNDERMKELAEKTNACLNEIQTVSFRQREIVNAHTIEANTQMDDLATQDETVGQICDTAKEDKDNVLEHVRVSMHDEIKSGIENISDSKKKEFEFTTDTIIAKTDSDIVSLKRPREELIAKISENLSHVRKAVEDRNEQINSLAKTQCSTADDLRTDVESKRDEFDGVLVKRFREEFDASRDVIANDAAKHLQAASASMATSNTQVSTTKTEIEDFTKNTIHCEDDVPPVDDRKIFNYCTDLTSTPPEDVIVKGVEVH